MLQFATKKYYPSDCAVLAVLKQARQDKALCHACKKNGNIFLRSGFAKAYDEGYTG